MSEPTQLISYSELSKLLHDKAKECYLSAQKNPSPNSDCFHIVAIVLEDIAKTVETPNQNPL